MTKRRMGTCPHRTFWTSKTVAAIETYQQHQQLPSFSAAAEALVRLGLEQSPTEVITPIVTSALHAAMRQETDRLIRLLLYAIMESGTAARLAGAALYRQRPADTPLKDWNIRYRGIKRNAQLDARRALAKPHITALIEEVYGNRQSQLSAAESGDSDGDDAGDHAGSEIL